MTSTARTIRTWGGHTSGLRGLVLGLLRHPSGLRRLVLGLLRYPSGLRRLVLGLLRHPSGLRRLVLGLLIHPSGLRRPSHTQEVVMTRSLFNRKPQNILGLKKCTCMSNLLLHLSSLGAGMCLLVNLINCHDRYMTFMR